MTFKLITPIDIGGKWSVLFKSFLLLFANIGVVMLFGLIIMIFF